MTAAGFSQSLKLQTAEHKDKKGFCFGQHCPFLLRVCWNYSDMIEI